MSRARPRICPSCRYCETDVDGLFCCSPTPASLHLDIPTPIDDPEIAKICTMYKCKKPADG